MPLRKFAKLFSPVDKMIQQTVAENLPHSQKQNDNLGNQEMVRFRYDCHCVKTLRSCKGFSTPCVRRKQVLGINVLGEIVKQSESGGQVTTKVIGHSVEFPKPLHPIRGTYVDTTSISETIFGYSSSCGSTCFSG